MKRYNQLCMWIGLVLIEEKEEESYCERLKNENTSDFIDLSLDKRWSGAFLRGWLLWDESCSECSSIQMRIALGAKTWRIMLFDGTLFDNLDSMSFENDWSWSTRLWNSIQRRRGNTEWMVGISSNSSVFSFRCSRAGKSRPIRDLTASSKPCVCNDRSSSTRSGIDRWMSGMTSWWVRSVRIRFIFCKRIFRSAGFRFAVVRVSQVTREQSNNASSISILAGILESTRRESTSSR